MNGYQPNFMGPNYGMYGPANAFQQQARYQPDPQQYTQPQPIYKQPVGLQGKSVDSIDVVKAMDIPLDGSISYFPLTDGTAIVTKQLQMDGSSKTIIYKPVQDEQKDTIKYITIDELEEVLNEVQDLKDELKDIKKEFKKKSKED